MDEDHIPNRCGSAGSECTRCGSGWPEVEVQYPDSPPAKKPKVEKLPSFTQPPPLGTIGPASPVDNLLGGPLPWGESSDSDSDSDSAGAGAGASGYTTPNPYEMSPNTKKNILNGPRQRLRPRSSPDCSGV